MRATTRFSILLICSLAVSCGGIKKISYQVPANKNNITSACLEPTKNYFPISEIKSRTSYLEKAYKYHPIESKKGFFAVDFSKDGALDYIFIEKQKVTKNKSHDSAKIRLVTCISSINQSSYVHYKRTNPKFTLYESIGPDFQAESHRIRMYKNELIISRNYHEHNWGSDQTTNTYLYENKKSDFILSNQDLVSSSGDGYRSDTFESYNFRDGKYTKQRTCGQFVGLCKSGTKSGSFKARVITLSNTENIFQTQVTSKDLY